MAQLITYVDDFDGTTSDGTVRTRKVELEHGVLVIDMSEDNYGKLLDALSPFIAKGTWTSRDNTGDTENKSIRAWAKAMGKEISARGRIPVEIAEEYREWVKSNAETTPATGTNSDDANDASDTGEDNGSDLPALTSVA